jgi:hypothetical protein
MEHYRESDSSLGSSWSTIGNRIAFLEVHGALSGIG